MFIGNSRMRNVALDAGEIALAARKAGVDRPVASTVLGVHWGGFERFGPAIAMIEARRPDAIVVMPELLTEDFTYPARLRFGMLWLGAELHGEEYRLFGADESYVQVCHGFDQTLEERRARKASMVHYAPASVGQWLHDYSWPAWRDPEPRLSSPRFR